MPTLPALAPPPALVTVPVLLTDAGRAALRRRAALLRTGVLPELVAELAHRDRDLRVDAEYHRVCGEIAVLEELVSTAGSTRDRPAGGGIGLGDRVALALPAGERLEVLLTCEQEAALDEVRISARSPLARALHGAAEGDSVTVLSPSGAYPARVLSVRRE